MRFHQPRLGDVFEFSVASAEPLELSDFGSATASDLLFAAAATGAFSPSPELDGVGEAEARQRARAERLVGEAGEAQAALLAAQAEKDAAREAAAAQLLRLQALREEAD